MYNSQRDNQAGIAHLVVIFMFTFFVVAVGLYVYQDMQKAYNSRNQPISITQKQPIQKEPLPKPKQPKEPEEIIQNRFYLEGDEDVFYLKEGNIWHIAFDNSKIAGNKLTFDYEEDIVSFDVSPNNKLIVFTVRRHDYSDQLYGPYENDTVLIKNLETQDVNVLFEVDPVRDSDINSVKFSDDNRRIVFTNNAVWVADVGSFELRSADRRELESFCSNFYVNKFSPNNDLVLVRMGCYEGAFQEIINLNDLTILKNFENGYVGGGKFAIDFIDNQSVLTYNSNQYDLQDVDYKSLFAIEGIYNELTDDVFQGSVDYYVFLGTTDDYIYINSAAYSDSTYFEKLKFDLSSKLMLQRTEDLNGVVVTSIKNGEYNIRYGSLNSKDISSLILVAEKVVTQNPYASFTLDINN